MSEHAFNLDVQGVRPAKGDKELLNPDVMAMRLVIDVGKPGAHTQVTKHLKPTRKALNGYQHALRLTAAPDSALNATLRAAVRDNAGSASEVTFAVHAMDAEQARVMRLS